MQKIRSKPHIIILGALPESLLNFRGDLIKTLIASECKVTACAAMADQSVIDRLAVIGSDFKSFPVERNRLDPISDLNTIFSLGKLFLRIKPDVVLAYTIKPIIWGGIAHRFTSKTRFYALITGLGFTFQVETPSRKVLNFLVTVLYRISLSHATKVIFQNPDNRDIFISRGIVPATKCELVNGSGVNLNYFSQKQLLEGTTTFLTIGRMLGEKGFREYAKAAKIVKKKYPKAIFQLLGPEDPSPDGIPKKEVESWVKQGLIDYLGAASDVRPSLKNCHIYVLPSYHEGLPRTVLEAMAIGRPILTTDVPGCRETVTPGENGFLVPKADALALAERMIWFIDNRRQWRRMGNCSRELVEDRFDVHKVNADLMDIMELQVS